MKGYFFINCIYLFNEENKLLGIILYEIFNFIIFEFVWVDDFLCFLCNGIKGS